MATDKNRLAVKLDTKHKADASYNDDKNDVVGVAIGAAVGGLIGSLLSGDSDAGSGNNQSNHNHSGNNHADKNQGMKKATTGYETILVDKNANLVTGLAKGDLVYIKCSDITRVNGDKRVFAMDSAGKKGYLLTSAVRGATCNW